jgi:hypothetical protein
MMMIEPVHVWVLSIFVLVFIFAYVKIKYPFWNIQPVFHSYDYWRMSYNEPFIVYKHRPIKTKFCDFIQVKTIPYLECSHQQQIDFVNLLQCYHIPSEKIIHDINLENVNSILKCVDHESFVSFYAQTGAAAASRPIATISSRIVNIYFDKRPQIPVYFIDYLCVNREHRDVVGVSRRILQTHEYNQRILNTTVTVSLIKKETELFDGIIPLVQYTTSTYFIRNRPFPRLPPHFQIVRISKDNMGLLHDFLTTITAADNDTPATINVIGDIGSLISMIKTELLFVFCLQGGEHMFAYYFIKNAKMRVEMDTGAAAAHTLQSICSVINTDNERLFYLGFLHCLHKIMRTNKHFKMIIFDEIGDNTVLMRHWRKKNTPVFENPAAYYLFNLIYPESPVIAEKCMILL